MVRFNATKKDLGLIRRIVRRAMEAAERIDSNYTPLDCEMDLLACHLNGNRLDLQKLLDADDWNFAHDIFGIRGHIDRETGKLKNCFLPRSTL